MRKEPVKVLVVDDSALVRKLLSHLLDAHPEIEVLDTAINAQDARTKIKRYDPDVVTLDIEMPGMDGLSFLEKIMTLRPTPVVMVSTLTQKGADASLNALRLGAFDCVAKPKDDLSRSVDLYRDELHRKVLSASTANVAMLAQRAERTVKNNDVHRLSLGDIPSASAVQTIVAIGASTGGTEAINHMLRRLPADTPGIVLAQHIPEEFCPPFAERLNKCSAMSVAIAKEGERVLRGHVYVAPGNEHLRIEKEGPHFVCRLGDDDPINRHRPSVDALFESVADSARNRAVGVLLTGMGKDGAQGLKSMRDNGARTLIQDEASSVVWGMPGAAYKLDAAEEVLDLEVIPQRTLDVCVELMQR